MRTGLAIKMSVGMAPEVGLRGRTLHYTLALKPRGNIAGNPKQVYQWQQNMTCFRQTHKNSAHYYLTHAKLIIRRGVLTDECGSEWY